MNYLFSKCDWDTQGNAIIPFELVERWTRQMNTPYDNLTDNEQESDKHQADKVLKVLDSTIKQLDIHT